MTIKVKKEIEETVVVPIPFASKDSCWHYLVTEEFIILATDGHITKRKFDSGMYDSYVKDALQATPVPIAESEAKINEVLESFQVHA